MAIMNLTHVDFIFCWTDLVVSSKPIAKVTHYCVTANPTAPVIYQKQIM